MKKVLMFLCVALMSCSMLFARTNATMFAAADVDYWVGTGSNSATIVIDFNNNEGAVAFGYRWNGSIMVANMMQALNDSIAGLTIEGADSYITRMEYVDTCSNFNVDSDDLTGMGWMYSVNDAMAGGVASQALADGDMLYWLFIDNFSASIVCPSSLNITYPARYGETVTVSYNDTLAHGGNYTNYGFHIFSWDLTVGDTILTRIKQNESPCVDDTIYVVNLHVYENTPALPELDFADINWWVGAGDNQAMLILDWTVDSVAVAFGYRWSGDKMVSDMMNDIATAVPGLTIAGASAGFVTSISYVDAHNNVNEVDSAFEDAGYWMYTVNNRVIMLSANQQAIANNDLVYWEYHTNMEDWSVVMPIDLEPLYPSEVPTAISYAANVELTLSPVPAVDVLTVAADEVMEHIVIFAANGAKMIEARPMESQASLNVSALEHGLYVVCVRLSDGTLAVRKFVKQ